MYKFQVNREREHLLVMLLMRQDGRTCLFRLTEKNSFMIISVKSSKTSRNWKFIWNFNFCRNGPVKIYGAPEYKTEVMLLGEGSYDLEAGAVELLIWLQVIVWKLNYIFVVDNFLIVIFVLEIWSFKLCKECAEVPLKKWKMAQLWTCLTKLYFVQLVQIYICLVDQK